MTTTKILVELPEDINKKVEVYNIIHKLKDKRKAIIEMIDQADVNFKG